ncbi:enoyl-CoA hydratase family protein [Dietzia sp. ANT_WB102]|uniref:enoyl-CoA hydratase family protein n=1 Tax=Dietzia sp. ANT_WB102 TaxID=2597345 RepID=UPI0011EF2812|nr:enoyl-CoA hydratase family protein [Dietzia sp. ANT_WB102]KAA0919089.1 enoyl-CoA hydratase family protein [Dietzia sp. ANT_WB102]
MSDVAEQEIVHYETSGGAARITLDSQHNRNAISTALVEQLHEALDRAARDDSARVVVLGHAGGTFCAGADLSEASGAGTAQSSPEEQAAERTRIFLDLLRAIISHPKPVIAAVDGHVRAGGMGLVSACDFAVAGPASSFALTEVRLGLAAAMISVPLAARMNSRDLARALLTGEKFDSAHALRIGLVSEAVEDVRSAVDELVAAFRPCSPQGLRENKALLAAPLLAELDARGEELAGVTARLFTTPEVAEGMAAFLERRQPSWANDAE